MNPTNNHIVANWKASIQNNLICSKNSGKTNCRDQAYHLIMDVF